MPTSKIFRNLHLKKPEFTSEDQQILGRGACPQTLLGGGYLSASDAISSCLLTCFDGLPGLRLVHGSFAVIIILLSLCPLFTYFLCLIRSIASYIIAIISVRVIKPKFYCWSWRWKPCNCQASFSDLKKSSSCIEMTGWVFKKGVQ